MNSLKMSGGGLNILCKFNQTGFSNLDKSAAKLTTILCVKMKTDAMRSTVQKDILNCAKISTKQVNVDINRGGYR